MPLPKINLFTVELWHWRLRHPSGQSSPWRMAALARGLRLAKSFNSRQARWDTFFNHFNFHLCYRTGSKNLKAFSHLHSPDLPPEDPSLTTSLEWLLRRGYKRVWILLFLCPIFLIFFFPLIAYVHWSSIGHTHHPFLATLESKERLSQSSNSAGGLLSRTSQILCQPNRRLQMNHPPVFSKHWPVHPAHGLTTH